MRNLPYRGRTQQTPQPSTAKRRDATPSNKNDIRDDDLDSSPAVPAPELHAEIFDTPARKSRIPGISVLTPGRERGAQSPGKKKQLEWDSDEDEDGEEAGLSPPKTMQFHVPQPRLLRTPGEFSLMLFCARRDAVLFLTRYQRVKLRSGLWRIC